MIDFTPFLPECDSIRRVGLSRRPAGRGAGAAKVC